MYKLQILVRFNIKISFTKDVTKHFQIFYFTDSLKICTGIAELREVCFLFHGDRVDKVGKFSFKKTAISLLH